jgi:hypothetical protein
VIFCILAFISAAFAVDVSFCAELRVNFDDVNSIKTTLDDDYIRTNDNVPARGATILAVDNVDGSQHELTLSDADPACGIMVGLSDSHSHDIKLLAEASLNDNVIKVYNNDTANALWAYLHSSAWMPDGARIEFLTTGTHPAWNILAASSWALHRRNAGISGKEFHFYTQECPSDAGNSCLYGNDLYIKHEFPTDLHPHSTFKGIITHEMGHRVAKISNGGAGSNAAELASPDGNCTSTDDGTHVAKQYASKAAVEGIAWYWTAVAFNNTTGSNCEIYLSGNWDQDPTWPDTLDNEFTPSCEGDPLQESWAEEDYLGNECVGTLEDRGLKLDYIRAFWDADHTQGLTTEQIFSIWDMANPDTWDADGGGGVDDPEERLRTGAAAVPPNVILEWNAVSSANGIR